MRKGISPLIASVLLIAMSVSIGSILLSFSTGLAKKESDTLKSSLSTQLACQYTSYYINNVTLNCNSNCAAGVSHTITLSTINSGKKSVNFTTFYILNATGSLFTYQFNETKNLNVGEVITISNVTTDTCTSYNASSRIQRIQLPNIQCSNTVASVEGSNVGFQNC